MLYKCRQTGNKCQLVARNYSTSVNQSGQMWMPSFSCQHLYNKCPRRRRRRRRRRRGRSPRRRNNREWRMSRSPGSPDAIRETRPFGFTVLCRTGYRGAGDATTKGRRSNGPRHGPSRRTTSAPAASSGGARPTTEAAPQRLRHAPAIRPDHWPTAGRATDRRAPARPAGGPAPAMDGASTVAVRDLVDGGGASHIPAIKINN